jgi:hypothetical protein
MNSMVAETEKDAIPVADVVRVIMEAATAPQPKVSRVDDFATWSRVDAFAPCIKLLPGAHATAV